MTDQQTTSQSAAAPPSPEPPKPPHTPTKWQRRIPNLLTYARIVLAIVVFLTLGSNSEGTVRDLIPLAVACFVLAAITDALDGYLARRWNAVSPFGRIMDPFADKVLVLGSFIIMLGPVFFRGGTSLTGFTPVMIVIIVGRELLVTSIRGVYESCGIDFSAGVSGKLKMILQSISIPFVLLIAQRAMQRHANEYLDIAQSVCSILAWVVTAVTIWSAVPYVTKAIRMRSALSD